MPPQHPGFSLSVPPPGQTLRLLPQRAPRGREAEEEGGRAGEKWRGDP